MLNHIDLVDIHKPKGGQMMEQLIGLIRLGALVALSAALYRAHRQRQATQTSDNHHSEESDRQAGPEGELVLLGLDGTVMAREVNLAPQGLVNE
jgi:hypothetical protein